LFLHTQKLIKIFIILLMVTTVSLSLKAQAGESEYPDFDTDGYEWDEYWQQLEYDEENTGGGGTYIGSTEVTSHTYIKNLNDALNMLDTDYETYKFDKNGAKECPLFDFHIQGIAYYNNTIYSNGGYYYITRSRKDKPYNEQLLIVSEGQAKVVKTMKLDDNQYHPSGIQIYDNIMVVPFNKSLTKFYSVSDPTNPIYLTSVSLEGECAGITEYQGKYLVAIYGNTRNTIRFLTINKSTLEKSSVLKWEADSQDKSNWTPYKTWQGANGTFYENMSLIKEQANSSTTPNYYIFMYHNNPDAIDVYSLSGLDFINLNPPNIQMIKRIEVSTPSVPVDNGFRAGGGVYISNPNRLTFFSTRMRLVNKTRINIYK
jgi:hypothetical protein